MVSGMTFSLGQPLCVIPVEAIYDEFCVNGAPWRSGKEYHPLYVNDPALLFTPDLCAGRD